MRPRPGGRGASQQRSAGIVPGLGLPVTVAHLFAAFAFARGGVFSASGIALSREGSTRDDPAHPYQRGPTRKILSRPSVWLGTLSTVVAIATGMFTLRDQLFPSESDTAAASSSVYQTSVGAVCTALNQANGALVMNADNLRRRLSRAETALAQRNAILDNWNVVLNSSQYELGQFEGLDAPRALRTRERVTAAAWNRIVTRLRGFTRQLDATSDGAGVVAIVLTLPAVGEANAADVVTRNAGLTELGGGRCVLNPPVDVPTITLPPLPGAPKVNVPVAPAQPMPPHRRKSPASPRTSQPIPKKTAPVTPSVSPADASPVPRPPRTVVRPPVGRVSPGVEPGGGSSGAAAGSAGASSGSGGGG